MICGLKPGCPVSIDYIVSCMKERMGSIGQALKVETFGRGQQFLALGVLVEIGREGSLRLTAPLDRIYQKMWAALSLPPASVAIPSPSLRKWDRGRAASPTILWGDTKNSDKDRVALESSILIASFPTIYIGRVVTYMATYSFVLNARDLKRFVARQMRVWVQRHLARLKRSPLREACRIHDGARFLRVKTRLDRIFGHFARRYRTRKYHCRGALAREIKMQPHFAGATILNSLPLPPYNSRVETSCQMVAVLEASILLVGHCLY
jgi:hypothetical protein